MEPHDQETGQARASIEPDPAYLLETFRLAAAMPPHRRGLIIALLDRKTASGRWRRVLSVSPPQQPWTGVCRGLAVPSIGC